MLYVCVRDVIDVFLFILWSCRWSCMGSMSVVMQMCVSCVHPVTVLNAGRGCKRRSYGRGILQSRSHDCLIGNHECPSVYPILLR